MGSPIQKLISDYQDLYKFLLENGINPLTQRAISGII